MCPPPAQAAPTSSKPPKQTPQRSSLHINPVLIPSSTPKAILLPYTTKASPPAPPWPRGGGHKTARRCLRQTWLPGLSKNTHSSGTEGAVGVTLGGCLHPRETQGLQQQDGEIASPPASAGTVEITSPGSAIPEPRCPEGGSSSSSCQRPALS